MVSRATSACTVIVLTRNCAINWPNKCIHLKHQMISKRLRINNLVLKFTASPFQYGRPFCVTNSCSRKTAFASLRCKLVSPFFDAVSQDRDVEINRTKPRDWMDIHTATEPLASSSASTTCSPSRKSPGVKPQRSEPFSKRSRAR